MKLYIISTLVPPKWATARTRARREDCTTSKVAEVWAARGSDAIAEVRAKHTELGSTYLVCSAAVLDQNNRLLTRS